MYVAFTRARDHVVISGNTPLQRESMGRGETPRFKLAPFESSNPGFMEVIHAAREAEALWLHTIPMERITDRCEPARPSPVDPPPVDMSAILDRIQPTAASPSSRLTISVTALSDFAICPRRYWLRWELGLQSSEATARSGSMEELGEVLGDREDQVEEEVVLSNEERVDLDLEPALQATDLGSLAHGLMESVDAVHYRSLDPDGRKSYLVMLAGRTGVNASMEATTEVLESVARALDGVIGEKLSEAEGTERESGFMLHVPQDPGQQCGGLFLRGRIDLLQLPSRGGPCEVLDYKYSRKGDLTAAHTFQLKAYALALHRRLGSPETARYLAGIVFLRSEQPAPTYLPELLTAPMLEQFAGYLAGLSRGLIAARNNRSWPMPEDTGPGEFWCKNVCGYWDICGPHQPL
jgi:ATP-dependent exoDNAse (exonuclease V) beta subunit